MDGSGYNYPLPLLSDFWFQFEKWNQVRMASHVAATTLPKGINISKPKDRFEYLFEKCRGWTKYWNVEEKIGLTNVNVKQCVHDVSCCGVWFLLSTRPSPWKKKTTLIFGGGAEDKVVQGLKILSIYCMFVKLDNFPRRGLTQNENHHQNKLKAICLKKV